jgi:hypothetical protein
MLIAARLNNSALAMYSIDGASPDWIQFAGGFMVARFRGKRLSYQRESGAQDYARMHLENDATWSENFKREAFYFS